MTTPINSRRGLRTPLANAVRRREADAAMEQGLPEGLTEDEVLRGTSSYDRVRGMRRAFQGPSDEPRIPNMNPDASGTNVNNYVRQRRANGIAMKKGGPVKTKPPPRPKVAAPKKATRPAGRSSKPSRSK
jgi:hypothetical protein